MLVSRQMWTGNGKITIAGGAWALLLLGCGGAAPNPKGSGESSVTKRDESRSACAPERSRARALAQAVEALAPPEVPPSGGKAESLAFIKGPMAAWVRSRSAATDEADRAITAALTCSAELEQGSLLLQRGRLQGHFVTAFLRVGEAGMPANFANDPQLKRAMLDSLLDAVKPQVDRARSSFEQCVALGKQAQTAEVLACAAELAALPQAKKLAAPTSGSASSSSELKPPRRLAYPRPFVETTQPRPCTFAGTLKLWRPALTSGSREVARFEEVELSRLTLPKARAGAFIVEVAWPIRGTFTLAAASLPFDLRSRVDLIEKRVWLSQGAAVSAAAAAGSNALVYRPLVGNATATPDPAVKVACSELKLAGETEPPAEDEKREVVNFKGLVQLSEAPGGPTIGSLTLREPEPFTLLARRSGWLHIKGSWTPVRDFDEPLPYDFDAWTRSTPTDETSLGMFGLLNEATPPTHTSIAELALFADPSLAQPVGKLVNGVPLLVGEMRDGFVNVLVPGMDAVPSDQSGFWAEKRAFSASVRAL